MHFEKSLFRLAVMLSSLQLALLPESVDASAFTVDDWDLTVSVFGAGDVSNEVDGRSFDLVANPFQSSHSSQVANSFSLADYDFLFDQLGDFRIETHHVADVKQFRSLRSTTSGDIFVTTLRDLTLHYSLTYDYLLPSDSMTARASIGVVNEQEETVLFNENRLHNTILGLGPGSFLIRGEAILAAGSSWRINYFSRILADDSSAGGVGTGTGVFEFQLTPEPHSLWLLLFGAGLLVKPRRRFVTR